MSFMLRKNPIRVALFIVAVVLGFSASSPVASAESFDN
jgi:hypothetical protein